VLNTLADVHDGARMRATAAAVRVGLADHEDAVSSTPARGPGPPCAPDSSASRNRTSGDRLQLTLACVVAGVTRSLAPTGRGKARWAMRWKPALNPLAITFKGRITPTGN
jgi:hypothetical protein